MSLWCSVRDGSRRRRISVYAQELPNELKCGAVCRCLQGMAASALKSGVTVTLRVWSAERSGLCTKQLATLQLKLPHHTKS